MKRDHAGVYRVPPLTVLVTDRCYQLDAAISPPTLRVASTPISACESRIPSMIIRFRCPNGHKLKVANRHSGNSAICPACRSRVTIPGRNPNPITDSAVVRLLSDEPVLPEGASRPMSTREPPAPKRTCPRCTNELSPSARICAHCNLYLFPSENTWKRALRAAKTYLHRS